MDWIDPRFADEIKAESEGAGGGTAVKSNKGRRKTLISRVRAALAQPTDVWSVCVRPCLGTTGLAQACFRRVNFSVVMRVVGASRNSCSSRHVGPTNLWPGTNQASG